MSDKQNNPKSSEAGPMSPVGFAGQSSFVTRHCSRRSAHHSLLVTRHYLFLVGALAACLFTAAAARGDAVRKPTLESIGNEVQCTCGCNATLNQCPMINCAEKAQIRAFISQEIAEGKGEKAILQDLALRFGVEVLSTPPAHGFNLAVWILPGVGLLAGLGIVLVIVRRWRRKPAAMVSPTSASRDAKVLSAVEEEMKSAGLG